MTGTENPKENPKEDPKDASRAVVAQHQAMLEALPFGDTADFDDAARGFLGTIDNAKITSPQRRGRPSVS